MLCLGIGLISNTMTLKHEALAIAPTTYRALQTLNIFLSPLGLILSTVTNLGIKGNIKWSKRKLLELGLFGVILTIVLVLLLTR
jgi:hypothetical protein